MNNENKLSNIKAYLLGFKSEFLENLKNEGYKFYQCDFSLGNLFDLLEDEEEQEKLENSGIIEYILDLKNETLQGVSEEEDKIYLIATVGMSGCTNPSYDKTLKRFEHCNFTDIVFIYYSFINSYYE